MAKVNGESQKVAVPDWCLSTEEIRVYRSMPLWMQFKYGRYFEYKAGAHFTMPHILTPNEWALVSNFALLLVDQGEIWYHFFVLDYLRYHEKVSWEDVQYSFEGPHKVKEAAILAIRLFNEGSGKEPFLRRFLHEKL